MYLIINIYILADIANLTFLSKNSVFTWKYYIMSWNTRSTPETLSGAFKFSAPASFSGVKKALHSLLEANIGLKKITMKKEGSSCTLGLWWVQNKFWLNHRNSYLHHEILKLLFCLNFIKKSIITFFHFCFWSVLRAVMCSFKM